MTSSYIDDKYLDMVLCMLMPENALCLAVSLETGLRVSDVLSLRSEDLKKKTFTVTEKKTGKKKKIRLSERLRNDLLRICGKNFVFQHRFNEDKHRTRQAVYSDVKRACKALRLDINVTPHSMRKHYAVELYHKYNSLTVVQEALNHDDEITTLVYALADVLSQKQTRYHAHR